MADSARAMGIVPAATVESKPAASKVAAVISNPQASGTAGSPSKQATCRIQCVLDSVIARHHRVIRVPTSICLVGVRKEFQKSH